MRMAWSTSGPLNRKQTMTNFSNARHTAISLAAAFVTAMVFVASAVGPAAHIAFA